MRISDWQTCALPICKKLSVLAHAYGDGFQMPTPPNGDRVQVPSATAALARLVEWRYNDLGALDARDNDPTPVLIALFAPHEPKTGHDGNLDWVAAVRNQSPADELVLLLKELQIRSEERG